MAAETNEWVLLVYRIPAQPTRLRLAVWRTLQRMGALYVQNAACLLPARADLVENMHYVAGMVEEMGGTCHLFSAAEMLPGGAERIVESFRAMADDRYRVIEERLSHLKDAADEKAEEDLKRERLAFLRAKRLAYFGGGLEDALEARLELLRGRLEERRRSEK